jgi:hypothetical protein
MEISGLDQDPHKRDAVPETLRQMYRRYLNGNGLREDYRKIIS